MIEQQKKQKRTDLLFQAFGTRQQENDKKSEQNQPKPSATSDILKNVDSSFLAFHQAVQEKHQSASINADGDGKSYTLTKKETDSSVSEEITLLSPEEAAKRYNQLETRWKNVEAQESMVMMQETLPLIKPYLDKYTEKYKDLSYTEIFEKISDKDRKKITVEIWNAYQKNIKKHIREKLKLLQEYEKIKHVISMLNTKDFDDFAHHVLENRVAELFRIDEYEKKMMDLMLQNGKQELSDAVAAKTNGPGTSTTNQ